MKVNKIYYFLMQDQFQIQPQYNEKFLKFMLGEISGKHKIEKTNFFLDFLSTKFQIITLVQKFIKKNKFSH